MGLICQIPLVSLGQRYHVFDQEQTYYLWADYILNREVYIVPLPVFTGTRTTPVCSLPRHRHEAFDWHRGI